MIVLDERSSAVAATVVTVGTFDGVHRGHQDVIARLVARARERARPSVLVTFRPHPLAVINPAAAPPLLTSHQEKLALFDGTGLDYVAVVPFTPEVASQSAEAFVEEVLRGRFGMSELLIGHDHGIGRGREGDGEMLRALGESRGFAVETVPPVLGGTGEPVSSTGIRRAIAAGALGEAERDLGRRYAVRGEVIAGEGRGRVLGYPTLNVLPDEPAKLLPPDGVYAVTVASSDNLFGGMMNLGGRPTFGDERRTLEAHLFDAGGDRYGDVVEIAFVARLRDTVRFPDAAALMAQLADDERAARAALTASLGSSKLNGSMRFPPSTP